MSHLLRMVGCAVARASWGFWAVVWKPNARRPGTRVAPGPGPSSGRPCYSGSRCFMGISFGLVLVEGLPAAGWATLLMRAPSVERGGGENGWADGLTGGAVRAGLYHRRRTSVERLLEPGLAASITVCGNCGAGGHLAECLMDRAVQTHRRCSCRRRRGCSCHRQRTPRVSGGRGTSRFPPSHSPEAKITGGGWHSGDRNAGPGRDESGFR